MLKECLDFMYYRYNIFDTQDEKKLLATCRALSSPERLRILRLLCEKNYTIKELASICYMTVSSIEFHIRILQEADLIAVVYQPSKKGKIKICQLRFLQFMAYFSSPSFLEETTPVRMEMPVGLYCDADLKFVSGFCTHEEQVMFDDGDYFKPQRAAAGLLWCSNGFVTYRFHNPRYEQEMGSIRISLEICSETLGYSMNWKSDITFSLCGRELCTYTSPGDYGDRPGLISPDWWRARPNSNTHYGDLKTILIDHSGCYLDGRLISSSITSEMFRNERSLLFRIENKPNATHIGGFNLFGRDFGDHPQDIRLELL